jgi:hypothetical protein
MLRLQTASAKLAPLWKTPFSWYHECMSEDEILLALRKMETDPHLITQSAYRADKEAWPGNSITFADIHLQYLKKHPSLNPKQYLANLRLMIKKQSS